MACTLHPRSLPTRPTQRRQSTNLQLVIASIIRYVVPICADRFRQTPRFAFQSQRYSPPTGCWTTQPIEKGKDKKWKTKIWRRELESVLQQRPRPHADQYRLTQTFISLAQNQQPWVSLATLATSAPPPVPSAPTTVRPEYTNTSGRSRKAKIYMQMLERKMPEALFDPSATHMDLAHGFLKNLRAKQRGSCVWLLAQESLRIDRKPVWPSYSAMNHTF